MGVTVESPGWFEQDLSKLFCLSILKGGILLTIYIFINIINIITYSPRSVGVMASLTKDDIWKVIQMFLGLLVIPLGGWVWNMNVEVAELRNDLGDAEKVISVLEKKIASSDDNAKNIIGIEKDIEYMKGSLGRIEQLVTSR